MYITCVRVGLVLDALGAFLLALDVFGEKRLERLRHWTTSFLDHVSLSKEEAWCLGFGYEYVAYMCMYSFFASVLIIGVLATVWIVYSWQVALWVLLGAMILNLLLRLLIYLIVRIYFKRNESFWSVVTGGPGARHYSPAKMLLLFIVIPPVMLFSWFLRMSIRLEKYAQRGQGLRFVGMALLMFGFALQFIGSFAE